MALLRFVGQFLCITNGLNDVKANGLLGRARRNELAVIRRICIVLRAARLGLNGFTRARDLAKDVTLSRSILVLR